MEKKEEGGSHYDGSEGISLGEGSLPAYSGLATYDGFTAREFKSEMEAFGYPILSTELSEDLLVITTSLQKTGIRFLIVLPEHDEIHITAYFVKFYTDKPSISKVNEYNNEYRWPRVRVDNEGLTLDMAFPLVGVDSKYIQHIFILWEEALRSAVDSGYLSS